MPVAGNNVECFELLIEKGQFVNRGKTRRPGDMVESDPAVALATLQASGHVMLQALGHNLKTVMDAWRVLREAQDVDKA